MPKQQQQNLLSPISALPDGPLHCLGKEFENDAERRDYFREQLKQHLADPEFRQIEGFPDADNQTILDLSDPPYYTICPNPFLSQLIEQKGKRYDANQKYHCEPFASDVSAGKNDTIYMAHSYHTKVPHAAIRRYIQHYTQPGDIVLDGFSGSGMTGVAATLCEDGRRFAILNDLSPAATFITHNYNAPIDVELFEQEARELIEEIKQQCSHLYRTHHVTDSGPPDNELFSSDDGPNDSPAGRINYTVWSEVMSCPQCGEEIVFFEHAVDVSCDPISVRKEFPCPSCNVTLTKRSLEKFTETVFDPLLGESIQRIKRVPVFVKYMVGRKHHQKRLDDADLELLESVRLENDPDIPPPFEIETGGLSKSNESAGLTHLHHYFTPRNYYTISKMLAAARSRHHHRQLVNLIQSVSMRLCSFLTTYQLGKRGNVPMTGTLYVGSLMAEANPIKALEGKLTDFIKVYRQLNQPQFVSTGSSASLSMLPDNCIDYVFIDPPFGDNLNYAQLNALWEGWLRARTKIDCEAIVDRHSKRDLHFYQEMLRRCLTEFHRMLKPGRWMTIEFHNSKNSVWNAIQEAILGSGFVIADVRTLDKKQGTPKQVNSANAVKQDLVISAYKPTEQFEKDFTLKAGTSDGIWDFVTAHLGKLPVFVSIGTSTDASRSSAIRAEAIAERQKHLLFDRMIAFHVVRGISIPMAAAEFYAGLEQRFHHRDGMYFLPEQSADYDRQRATVSEVEQLQLFVSDERSAIQWVRQQLADHPMTFQQLQPIYMKEAGRAWGKHEHPIELLDILRDNFVCDGDEETWRVPDPNKEADLEQLRQRSLLKEFEQYTSSKGKLKVVRTEALRAGFKDRWQSGDYQSILALAKRMPKGVIEEDAALLMYVDNALMRTED